MATGKQGLVDKVKRAVARVGTRGALTLVEGTAAAVRTVDRFQEKLSSRGRKVEAAAPPEAPGVGGPQPRRAPARTAGRKTLPVAEAAAKRSKAPAQAAKKPPKPGDFKVKRGQKHLHSGR